MKFMNLTCNIYWKNVDRHFSVGCELTLLKLSSFSLRDLWIPGLSIHYRSTSPSIGAFASSPYQIEQPPPIRHPSMISHLTGQPSVITVSPGGWMRSPTTSSSHSSATSRLWPGINSLFNALYCDQLYWNCLIRARVRFLELFDNFGVLAEFHVFTVYFHDHVALAYTFVVRARVWLDVCHDYGGIASDSDNWLGIGCVGRWRG